MSHDVALLPARGSTPQVAVRSRHFLGSYSPFAGVTYYALLDDLDVLEGRNKIGGVGWRIGNMAGQDTSSPRPRSSRATSASRSPERRRRMSPKVSLRETAREDVDRIAEWLEDEEIANRWFGYAGRDALHRGYDPVRMQMAYESEWDAVFRLDPQLLVYSVYNEGDEHIGECQLVLDGEGDAYPSVLIGRKDLWRRGYGTSAVTSLMARLFEFHGVKRIRVDIPRDNAAALGLFEKLGFLDQDSQGNFRSMYRERNELGEVDIFRDLTYEQIERVAMLGQRIDVPAGHELGRAGEPGDQLYVITEGQAELSTRSALGDITVRIAEPAESFPLASLIGSRRLITSAVAMTDMKLLAIPSDRLLALCSEDTDIGMRIFTTIADVLGTRYKKTLTHLADNAEKALMDADFFANV